MKSETITPNLIQLTRLRFVNAFLVGEDDGFTLVDTTMGNAADDLVAAAATAGGPIRRIALTHGHGDHVGALDALKEKLGDSVEVLMPELDARIHAARRSSTASSRAAGRHCIPCPTCASSPATASAASR